MAIDEQDQTTPDRQSEAEPVPATPLERSSSDARRIDRIFEDYASYHRNIVSYLIQWLALPLLFWAVLALLWVIPYPEEFAIIAGLNWAWIAAMLASFYYLSLSFSLALAMFSIFAAAFSIIGAYQNWGDLPLWQLATVLFLLAWFLRFIGHKIEGSRPSFGKELHFWLIGPAWLLRSLLKLFGLRV